MKFLKGFILGAIVGILYAPDKGTETRRKISRAGEDLKDSIMDKFNELGDALSEKFDDIKDEANDILDKGKRKSKNVREGIDQSYS